MSRLIITALAILTLFAGSAQAGNIVIDDFASVDLGGDYTGAPNSFFTLPGNWLILAGTADNPNLNAMYAETGLATVLGGTRKTTVAFSDTFGNSASMSINNGGLHALNTGPGSTNDTSMTYAGSGALGLQVNLSQAAGFNMEFDPDQLSLNRDSILSITLQDFDGATSTAQEILPLTNPAPAQNVFIGINEFSGVDLNRIYSISWAYQGGDSEDVRFTAFCATGAVTTAVPVPAAVYLLGAGLVGLFVRRRS